MKWTKQELHSFRMKTEVPKIDCRVEYLPISRDRALIADCIPPEQTDATCHKTLCATRPFQPDSTGNQPILSRHAA